MTFIQAWDCFSGYGKPNFTLVSESVKAMWHQCGQGNEPKRNDPLFHVNTDAAREAGIAVGAYFFVMPLPNDGINQGRDPKSQAARFAATSGMLGSQRGELSPMVDAEWPPPHLWSEWGCTATQISQWLKEFCEATAMHFGRLPVIYTYPDFWQHLIAGGADVSWASRYMLWIAHYLHPGPGVPTTEKPMHLAPWGESWSIWQYSADGSNERIPGCAACPVDRDVIRDADTLRRLLGLPRYDTEADTQPVEVPVMQRSGFSNLDYDPSGS